MDITVDCSECYVEIFKGPKGDAKYCDLRISPKTGSGGLFLRGIDVEKIERIANKLKG